MPDLDRTKLTLKTLSYLAGVIFAAILATSLWVSSDVSLMEDTAYQLYHDTVDVHVYWFESKACIALPPDGYLANCTYLSSIRIMTALAVLLIIVLVAYAVERRKSFPLGFEE